MRLPSIAFATMLLGACSGNTPDPPPRAPSPAAEAPSPARRAPAEEREPVDADAVAWFAGGCFWGVEHFLEKIDGVASVESGYMGGEVDHPTYAQVSAKTTGHLEAVEVRYDSKRVTYEALAKRFFEIHDPTQADGQGPDLGPQYRSAIFVGSPREKEIVDDLIARLKARGYDVVTQVRDAGKFWAAEDYHQDYYVKTRKTPYCHAPVDRFGDTQ
jgi:peptide methionine sulfoxide reductase msrA/msrB